MVRNILESAGMQCGARGHQPLVVLSERFDEVVPVNWDSARPDRVHDEFVRAGHVVASGGVRVVQRPRTRHGLLRRARLGALDEVRQIRLEEGLLSQSPSHDHRQLRWHFVREIALKIVEQVDPVSPAKSWCECSRACAKAVEPIRWMLLGKQRDPVGQFAVIERASDAGAASRQCGPGVCSREEAPRARDVIVEWTLSVAHGMRRPGSATSRLR